LAAQGCGESHTTTPGDGGSDGGDFDPGHRGTVPATGTLGDGGVDAPSDAGGEVAVPGTFPLTPVRRTSYRRITNFQRGPEAKFITGARISADGTRIVFGAASGTFTIASDGSNMVQLSDKKNNGHLDISADGKKVAWYDDSVEGWAAGSDGTGKIKLAGTHSLRGMRMTAAGDQIFEIAPDAGGLIKVPADGSALTVIMPTADVAKLNGVDANGNHWRGVLDVSDDGGKVVFTFLWDAFRMMGDGTGLQQLTQFLMPENRTLSLVRVSGNGAKVAWNVVDNERSTVTIADWAGGAQVIYAGNDYKNATSIHLPGTGAKAALSTGLLILDTAKVSPFDAIDSGSASIPLGKPAMATLTADTGRACLVIEGQESTDQGRPNQLVVVDFEPPTTNGAPAITGTASDTPTIANDGTKTASIFAAVTDADVTEVNTVAMRGGLRLGLTPWLHWPLEDTGLHGDTTAKDTIYSTNTVALPPDNKVAPGPFTLRFVASNKAGHVLMIDTEGLAAKAP
jgi:hypothetical protein